MHGVPVLGPLLFIISMNDLPNVVISSHLHLLALMCASGAGPTLVQHSHKLNSDLTSLFEWVTLNGFMVNISKCQSMLFTRMHLHPQLTSIQLLLNCYPTIEFC